MADKEQIKDAILKTAGYPGTGVIAEMAEAFAQAIIDLDTKAADTPNKEVRVVKAGETR